MTNARLASGALGNGHSRSLRLVPNVVVHFRLVPLTLCEVFEAASYPINRREGKGVVEDLTISRHEP